MSLADHILRQHVLMRRALAVLLLLLSMALARIAVIAPVHALVLSQAKWRTQARHQLSDDKGRASAEGTLREQLRTLPRASVWSRFYPSDGARNPDTALRSDLVNITTTASVTVQSLALLPTDEKGALRRHGMRIVASMTIDQLEHLVADLRRQSRYLRVGQLTISAPIVQPPHTNPLLLVQMVVYGYSIARHGSNG
ncbi:MAG: GspMb/PilO family protein [Steroidobacteraceae bacterium]